jgi:hypothetical protein
MNNELIAERARAALDNKLPVPCGLNCPVVCCDPVITGFFLPKNLLMLNDNYTAALKFIQDNINLTLDMETTDGKKCFKFEGVTLTEIDTNDGFLKDDLLEKIISEKVGTAISQEKMKEYLVKIKE